MLTKIKLVFWLLSLVQRLIEQIEVAQFQKRTEEQLLDEIDNKTLTLLRTINRRRVVLGASELRQHDEFERT